jgi:hypothetical protein
MEEWAFRFVYPDGIASPQREEMNCHMSHWPIDLLTYCLSFTSTEDTLSVMLVCKRWYESSRRDLFWSGRVKRAIAHSKELRMHFNPCLLVEYPFRFKFEWIFIWKNRIGTFQNEAFRLDGISNNRCHIILSKDRLTGAYWTTFRFDNDLRVSIIDRGNLRRVVNTDSHIDSITCFVPESDAIYTGECTQLEEGMTLYNLLPHGRGRWVFSDGRIFEGGAFLGEPDGIGIDEHGRN